MRHGKKFNSLGRKKGHRRALLMNLSNALIKHKRINTTLAKAKALRVHIEPLVTKAKTDSVHSKRIVFGYLQNKEAIKELFGPIAEKVGDRPGGYTRVIKTGFRKGDGAEMGMIEFVDFNTIYTSAKPEKKGRRRRKKKGGNTEAAAAATAAAATAATSENKAADDLTKIEGIGPAISKVLTAQGVVSFSDLADMGADEVKSILEGAEGNFAAHDPTTWPKQAEMAAQGKWDELKKWQDELDGGKEVSSEEE